jgi:hypothetical protein
MYRCSRCGGALGEKRGICPHCGCFLWYDKSKSDDSPTAGILVLLALSGIAALGYWLWPRSAHLAGTNPNKDGLPVVARELSKVELAWIAHRVKAKRASRSI